MKHRLRRLRNLLVLPLAMSLGLALATPAAADGDTTAPDVTGVTITPTEVDHRSTTPTVTVTARVVDAGSGVAMVTPMLTRLRLGGDLIYKYADGHVARLISGDSSDGVWQAQFTFWDGATEQGTWMLSVGAQDQAFNNARGWGWRDHPGEGEVRVGPDTIAPVLSLKFAGRSGYDDAWHISSGTVTVAVTSSDPSGVVGIRLSSSSATRADRALQSAIELRVSDQPLGYVSQSLVYDTGDPSTGGTETEGLRMIHAQAQDGAGNWGPVSTLSVVDQTPPTGSFLLNGGAATTGEPLVQVTTEYHDALSERQEFRISDRPDSTAGLLEHPLGSWERLDLDGGYSTGPEADRIYTYYAQSQDTAGNWSSITSQSIRLDRSADPGIAPPRVSLNGDFPGPLRTIPAAIEWEQTAAGIQPCSYETQRSLNGGPFVGMGPAVPFGPLRLQLASGSYRFRARISDCSGALRPWVVGERFRVATVQEDSPSVSYSGTWTSTDSPTASGGRSRGTTARGASVKVSVKAAEILMLAPTGVSTGAATLYIDGQYHGDLYSYTPLWTPRETVLHFTFPTAGWHSIRIVNQGTPGQPRLDVDAFLTLVR